MNRKDNHSRSTGIQSLSNRNLSRIYSSDSVKNVELKVECNSKLQRARFHGVSMQRRSSISQQSFVLSSNNVNNKSQNMNLSTDIHPSVLNLRSKSISKKSIKSNQHDISNELDNKKNKKNSFCSRRKIFLCIIISILLILLIVLSIVLPLKLNNSNKFYFFVIIIINYIYIFYLETTSSTNQLTTTQNFACTSGSLICSTPIFHWNYYCTPTSYNYYSCCYLSPISTQLTIEFYLQDDISHWSIDDISAIQNNGELIINGGFESNLNGWILTMLPNATTTTYVHNQISSSHTGSSYLYGGSQNAPAYLKQTFNIIQGQNINISFWWADEGSTTYIPGKICQATVKLI